MPSAGIQSGCGDSKDCTLRKKRLWVHRREWKLQIFRGSLKSSVYLKTAVHEHPLGPAYGLSTLPEIAGFY